MRPMSKTDNSSWVWTAFLTYAAKDAFQVIVIVVALTISATFFFGIADPVTAKPVIEAAGYKNITISDTTKVFGCDSKDLYHTEFWATGQNGTSVHGVVCASVFKGSTIRML
jgi:hypothetical protein